MNTLDITLKKNNKPIFSWCPSLEEGALQQIKAIAELPFVEHLALMPDAHLGMEMPIGGVVGCSSVIVPNFVGVDIGCGMAAIKTNIVVSDIQSKEEIIHHAVERSIPMGFSHNTDERRKRMEQKYSDKIDYVLDKNLIDNLHNIVDRKSFFEQMGSLGGGNHFIEVQYDENDNVWIMLHSGSRNIGKKICDYFNNMAKDINSLWYSNSPIGFLPVTTDVGKAYIGWMNIALKFAYYNRQAMMDDIWHNIEHYFPNIHKLEELNIHHNYASLENHFGKNLWVHRKGATLADDKTIGIIPGSMGSFSYIVQGLGKKESLNSCSHGAGRRMGRKVFNEAFNSVEKIKEIETSLEGVYHTKFGRATSKKGKDLGMLDVSEAPQAYKDIDEVMSNQMDLVKPLYRLKPLINWKDAGEE